MNLKLKLKHIIRQCYRRKWTVKRLTKVATAHFISAECQIRSELNGTILDWLEGLDFETLLDIGSQQGQFAGQFQRKQVTCIDVVEETVRKGKKRFPNFQWICDDFRTCKFNEKYDLVSCLNALYYFYSLSIWEKLKTVTGKYLLLSWGDQNWEAYYGKTSEQIISEAGKHFKMKCLIKESNHTMALYENFNAAR